VLRSYFTTKASLQQNKNKKFCRKKDGNGLYWWYGRILPEVRKRNIGHYQYFLFPRNGFMGHEQLSKQTALTC
jgi:hypothetical protein